MRTIFTTILILILVSSQGQTIQTKSGSTDTVKEFKNQGEQEDSLAAQLFEKSYLKQKFEKYDSTIVTSGDTVKYAGKYFLVWIADKYKSIFSSGIFYPTIIAGQSKRDYKLAISNFEELKFLNHSPTQKRFRFWLNRNTLLNPTVCFIELTNQSANR